LDWESQISELLNQIAPSIEDDKIVGKLACLVKQAIKPMIPEIEVVGFASGDLTRKKAFGVAVPDVDVVVNVNPIVLAERLGGRHESFNNGKLDPKKLQKSAIRACTDRLVSVGGFKFRRSAFRGEEPKVTLLAPASFGICSDAIPIDFSVNAVSPLHNAALLTECGHMEPRARELILLVKRWAKDRGICHAAKGHLSPYAWSLLCIFFLQNGLPDGETLLPSLDGFKSASRLAKRAVDDKTVEPPTGSNKTTSQLFADFMNFYHQVFEWKTEAVCVRTGQRGKPSLALPLHIIVEDDGKTTVIGPSIEDPFDETHNLGSGMTAASLNRLKEELTRAHETCSKPNSSLAELLEPWAPPEQESEEREDESTKVDASRTSSPSSDAPWRKQS
jgi:DNA polymerase sigma